MTPARVQLLLSMQTDLKRVRRSIVERLQSNFDHGEMCLKMIEAAQLANEDEEDDLKPVIEEVQQLCRQLKHCMEIIK